MTTISYPVADLQGEIVWASDLARDQSRPTEIACVGCGSRMVLKAGARNTAHFAHHDATQCTNPETALHRAAKRIVADAIYSARQAETNYFGTWYCTGCDCERRADLASPKVSKAVIEQHLGDVQPDIVLIDHDEQPRLALEVVVTHPPSKQALAWYQTQQIGVLTIEPTWETIEQLRSGLPATSAHGMRCLGWRHPLSPAGIKCQCGQPVRSLRLELSHGSDCWRCHRSTRALDVIDVAGDETQTLRRCSDPSLRGIERIAANLQVGLWMDLSKTENRRYVMHHCQHCDAKTGDHFQYEQTADNTLVAGTPVRHMLLCEAGHWTENRTSTVPDAPPQRIVGAFTSGSRITDDPPLVTYQQITPQQAIRRMLGHKW